MVRPERVGGLADAGRRDAGTNVLKARVDTMTFRGARTAVMLDCGGFRLEAEVANVARRAAGVARQRAPT